MRDFINAILSWIGCASLSDSEYNSIDQTGLTVAVYNVELYNALGKVLISRESVSTASDRLRSFFLSKGVAVDPLPKASSNILIGIPL